MLIKSQDGKLYADFSICASLMLEGWMVMWNLTYPHLYSIIENNLRIFIADLSYFNRKLCSLEKFYLLQEFYSSTWSHFQRSDISNHPLRPRRHISSHSLTTTKNWLYTQGEIFMDSIVIYKRLDTQLHWTIQVSALVILVLHFPSTMIQQPYIQLLQLSFLYRILFANAV